MAEIPAVFTEVLRVLKAIAKQTAALAKPYIAQTVINGLKPVVAIKEVSIMINIWGIPVMTAIGYKKPMIKPPIPNGR
ncbi:hypothetical protein KQJ29_34095, partial [Enterococcus sp. S181_ASV_20]|nr:hypothetical protein [Enterococcus sp. S181_ASV_20]